MKRWLVLPDRSSCSRRACPSGPGRLPRRSRRPSLTWLSWAVTGSAETRETCRRKPGPPRKATRWSGCGVTSRRARPASYEILTLTAEGPNVVLRIRHFDPKLVAREEKDRAVELPLVAKAPREAAFEGPEYDVKGTVRIIYRRGDDDTLTAVLEKEGRKQEFRFRRR